MRKIILQFILTTIAMVAFEVNTHQAITRCALTQECSSQGGISNSLVPTLLRGNAYRCLI